MDPGELQMVREVVRPKTPRGDGNWIALTGLALILVVVRPKTPRGDGNSTSISLTSPGEKITSSDPKPRVNRPGMSGDSSSWKGWGHVRWFIEEVPAGAA
ncbi:MmpS family membrane protein [Mycobacterium tuberculosis]|nr:MmpS family membrane protein [Mycobacterium tuberculosis]COU61139.1 MmpS family membrane protein [Mycobacterium tuberculosis]